MTERNGTGAPRRADVIVVALTSLILLVVVSTLFSGSRERSIRIVCKANLSQIGKAMLIYTGDYEGAFPRAGGPTTAWGYTPNWMAPDRYVAFGLNRVDASGGSASVSASLYLLVKYLKVPPRLFVCKGDEGTTEFKLAELVSVPPKFELVDAWDFGRPAEAVKHCSYGYHIPYDPCALTVDRDPNFAVAADRNPWIISPAAAACDFVMFRPDIPPWNGSAEQAQAGNAITHLSDGQNILFLDGRVSFETRSYCGVEKGNIYTLSTGAWGEWGDPLGIVPLLPYPHLRAANTKDSFLVHDPPDTRRR